MDKHNGFVAKYIFSQDHKTIGKQYLITGLVFALIGGSLAHQFRDHLSFGGVLTEEMYNTCVTMHGTIMVFWVAMPILIGAFGNFLIPLMIGTRDMAFPVLNMMSFWIFFTSGIVLIASFFVAGGAFSGGWTGYPPLSADSRFTGADLGIVLWVLALALEFISMLMGGINYITTVLNMRARGLSLMKLPMLVWMEIIASVIFLLSIGPLIAGAGMLLLDKIVGTHFFRVTATGQGDPVLWQHLFWFFGHPEVYVILLPALGILAEIFTTYSRKPLYGYKAVVYSTIIAGGISFIVWAHHMFVSGLNFFLASAFSITTIIISIPFFILMVCLALTMWNGSIRLTSAMLGGVGSLLIFTIGGVTGLFLGAEAGDIYLHDTYFVVAHFHYTLFSTSIMAALAGIYHWFPKMFGRMMNETLGRIHVIGTFVFFNLFAFPLFFLGLAGHPRRYSSGLEYNFLQDYQWINHLSTFATMALLGIQLIFIYNFFTSMIRGQKAESNPWRSTTLEWMAPTPVPHGNWPGSIPVVESGPYEYSQPGSNADFKPQGAVKI
ncbi:MAG: cbb3-type cytochrome c oxidase subunit I [Planctomycetes bacterium]|nr:cbb3-type cytochrome c oxidase subunit I [Planctomycetota bacterium]